MSFAVHGWPDAALVGAGPTRGSGGVGIVTAVEIGKLVRLVRVRVVLLLCLLSPFAMAAVIRVQSSVPADTLFGQWLHESGFALPMVILGFVGQWGLPLLASIVCGDIFSSEDHLGTWKTVLTRSCTRGQVYVGKVLAGLGFTVLSLVLLASASLVAGLLLGTDPVVGLTGQLVPAGQAVPLVLASWASQLPPLLGFASLAVLLSVATRNSPVGMGGPLLVGLAMQLLTLVSLPTRVRDLMLSTPFAAWHGFWVQDRFYGPLWTGLLTSAVWFLVCGAASWLVFHRRSIAVS